LPVGKTIALLVEEGDDISNLEIPKEDEPKTAGPTKSAKHDKRSESAPPAPSPAPPKHSASHIHVDGPVFPSVIRLLNEAGIADYKKIKGTGVRGMLTKGDVLAYIGKASSPTGTYRKSPAPQAASATPAPSKKEVKVSSFDFNLPYNH
jgi:pyruvate/2-oxoglutarate dehydrogenase complex dihydrolipoamide acyltransferase (E2) component